MKIAVVAANGAVGQAVVKEALNRNFEVTAIARSANKTEAQHFLQKDIFDLTRQDLAGYDAVINAFGTFAPALLEQHSTSLMHICDLLSGTSTRLLVVGGAGSLYLDKEHTLQLKDSEGFPEEFKLLADAMGNGLAELRKRADVRWTYVSPPADFQADGARTGKYILAGEEFSVNAKGESVGSYADYAIAMLDEVQAAKYVGKRISVVGE